MTEDTGHPGSPETPEITEVRRLLGEARHADPLPPEVATRLDDVLAGLRAGSVPEAADDLPSPAVAPVIPIEAHRRRRAASMLVAAAAIVVGGVVLAQHRSDTAHDASAGSSVTSAEDRAAGQSQPSSGAGSLSPTAPRANNSAPSSPNGISQRGLLVVHPSRFSADALRGQRLILRHATFGADSAKTASSCVTIGGGSVGIPASYRRAPAVLVYRPAEGSSQVVDLFVCGSDTPVRSVTLPTP